MEGKIHFKITHEGVTRRFAISLCEGDLLSALKTRVERMTGAVDLLLFWKDEDSLIVLDSVEDMDAAVDYAETKNKLACVALVTGDATKDTFEEAKKVEIKVVTEKESAKAFEGSAVKCNVCACYLAPSNGGRYKCMVCAEFELCAACFAKGVHANHALLFMRDGQTVVSAKDRYGGEALHMRVNNVSGTPKFFLDMSADMVKAENETREHVFNPTEESEKRSELGKPVAVDVGQNLFAVQEKSRQLKEARLAADKLDKQSEDAEVSLKNKEAAKEKKREEERKKKREEYRKNLQYSRDEMYLVKYLTDMMPSTRGNVFTGEAKCEDQHAYSRKAMIDIGKATTILGGSAFAAAERSNILSCGGDSATGSAHPNGVQDFIAAGKRLHALGNRVLKNHRSDSYIDDQLLQQRDYVFPARARDAPPGLGGEHRDMNRKPPGLGEHVAPPPGLVPLTGQIRHRPGTWALDHNFSPASRRFDPTYFPDYDPTVARGERAGQLDSRPQRPPRDLRAAYQDMLRSLDDRVDPDLAKVHPGLGKFKDVNGEYILPSELEKPQRRETSTRFGSGRNVVTEKTGRGGDDAGLLPRAMPLDRWLENYGKACEADALDERRRGRDRRCEERRREGVQAPEFRNGLEQFYENSYLDSTDRERDGYNALDFGQPGREDRGGFGGPRDRDEYRGVERSFDRYAPRRRRDEDVAGSNDYQFFTRDLFGNGRVTTRVGNQAEKDRKLLEERAYQKASQIPAAMATAVIDEIEDMPVDEMIAKLREYMNYLYANTWNLKPHPRIFKAVDADYEDELTGNIAVDLEKHLKSLCFFLTTPREIPRDEKSRQICVNTLARRRDLLREALLTTATDYQYSEYAKIASELRPILLTADYTGTTAPTGNWDEVASGFMELDCRRNYIPPPRVASANPDKEGLFARVSRGDE